MLRSLSFVALVLSAFVVGDDTDADRKQAAQKERLTKLQPLVGAWRGVFRQLIALGFARVDHDAHGALKLTAASRAMLKGERRFELRRVMPRQQPAQVARTSTPGDLSPASVDLLLRLKAWRLAEARNQSLPAYVIFHDSTLVEIARSQPQDLDALRRVSGLGATKLERYGAVLLALIAQML